MKGEKDEDKNKERSLKQMALHSKIRSIFKSKQMNVKTEPKTVHKTNHCQRLDELGQPIPFKFIIRQPSSANL